MRKILAGFLATAMVASVGATMTFAANRSASFRVDLDSTAGGVNLGAPGATTVLEHIDVKLLDGAATITQFAIPVDVTLNHADTDDKVGRLLNGKKATNIEINGVYYDCTIRYTGNGAQGAVNDLQVTFSPAAEIPGLDGVELQAVYSTNPASNAPIGTAYSGVHIVGGSIVAGADDITSNVGDSTLDVRKVLVCDPQGNPIPLVKDGAGFDKQINDDQGVQSDNKVYFMIRDTDDNGNSTFYGDDKYYKVKITKGDNAKQIKSVKDVIKTVSSNSDLYNVLNGSQISGTRGRHRFMEVALNPNYTTDEYKLTFDLRLTPTSDAVTNGYALDSEELKIKDFSVWMKNIEREADNDWKVGVNGLMLKPLSNDWNNVTWFDEDGDLAHMKFFADSDVDSFYSKLSTKWEHADYASYFNDQDAYIFDFTGSPKLSSTSRADLEIYNPFVDEDGNETIDPSTAVIYQVIDGDLFDVTDSFEYKETESGDMAYSTRTRFLGTYIICEKPVEEAVDDSTDVPADLVPEDTTPSEVTPGTDNGGKAPANTGKYL